MQYRILTESGLGKQCKASTDAAWQIEGRIPDLLRDTFRIELVFRVQCMQVREDAVPASDVLLGLVT
jgi:hypothetical protein